LKVDFNQFGKIGLIQYDGMIYEEINQKLIGIKGIEIYKEMSEEDAVIGALLFAIEMLIRQVDWSIESYSDEKKDLEMADFVKSNMMDMSHSWEDLISEILSMLVYGWSYHEICYKKRNGFNKDVDKNSRFNDGKIGWSKISVRSQESLYKWELDNNGNILGMYQRPAPNYNLLFVPYEKSLLFRTVYKKNNPEGRSILRNAYRSWYFKKNIEIIEGIGIERDLAGLPVAWVPPELLNSNASVGEKSVLSEIKNIVRNIRRDEQEGIVFPMAYDENNNKIYNLELLSSSGSRQFNTNEIIQRYDNRIAMTVLADFILLGHEKVGSFALSSDKTNLFSVALGAWLKSICEVFNRKAIPDLFLINGFDVERLPRLVFSDIESMSLEELGNYINKLAVSGVSLFPNKELEDYLLRVANLPINNI
jgi:hypothetical protein